jgi:hypothetical protein
MAEPLPDDDIAPPADPFEAELVAYLDGELDPASARRIETKLASDPQARAKATTLKKTYDLLDYLPKPEPSATFTSRTLDKLPAVQASNQPAQAQPAVPQSLPKSSRMSQPVARPRIPTQPARPQALLSLATEPTPSRRVIWAAGIILAVTGFAAAGYLGGNAFRSSPAPSPSTTSGKESVEELALSDRRLIENLPLYAEVDDFPYVNELAKSDYFGDDPTIAFDPALKVPSAHRDIPSGTHFASLEKAFRELSPERQQAIRELDKKIYVSPPTVQDRLLRVMEAHAIWFNLLPESDRKNILMAKTSELRLKQVRAIREKQWIETLPPNQQKQLMAAADAMKNELIKDWRSEDLRRRKEWSYAQKNPGETLDPTKVPWPFNDEAKRNEIEAFAITVFRLDDAKKIRLTANELDRYSKALSLAKEHGGAYWYSYGKTVYDLVRKPEHEELLLPPPADSKFLYTDFHELPVVFQKFAQQVLRQKLTPLVGKWPEFPLELHKNEVLFHQHHKEGFSKGEFPKTDMRTIPPLGASKVSDFAQPIRRVVENDLLKSLNADERKRLQEREGKWPDYPREIIQLARDHNLSIPGIMLPGSPKMWDTFYGLNRSK